MRPGQYQPKWNRTGVKPPMELFTKAKLKHARPKQTCFSLSPGAHDCRSIPMSASSAFPHPHGLGYTRLASKWGWFVTLGVVMIVMGIFALGDVVAVTLASAVFIGAFMLVGGVFQIIHSFANKEWSGFLFSLLCGAFYILGGILIMMEPVQGSLVITLFLVAAMAVGGVLRIMMALRHREMAYWWLLLLGGIISIVLAIMLYMSLPWSGLWLLGTLIAIELLMQGASWLRMGLSLRHMNRTA
jgi:uncharacterized membrane protein HdeD (DUF308 family)